MIVMPNPFTLAVTFVALSVFLNFVWAIRRFFVAPENPQPGMLLISILGFVFMVVHLICLWTGHQPVSLILLAILLYVMSLGLFWWSISSNHKKPLTLAYSHDRPQHLVKEGP